MGKQNAQAKEVYLTILLQVTVIKLKTIWVFFLFLFRMMNLNNPLQIGGVSTTNLLYPKLTITSYKGCIRNVMSQGKYYDLKNPSYMKGTVEECPMIDQHCKRHDCDPRATCVPSWSGHSCSCPLGLTGLTCGKSEWSLA